MVTQYVCDQSLKIIISVKCGYEKFKFLNFYFQLYMKTYERVKVIFGKNTCVFLEIKNYVLSFYDVH